MISEKNKGGVFSVSNPYNTDPFSYPMTMMGPDSRGWVNYKYRIRQAHRPR